MEDGTKSLFLCPVNHEVMLYPYITIECLTYDYRALSNWVSVCLESRQKATCPVHTNKILELHEVRQNMLIEKAKIALDEGQNVNHCIVKELEANSVAIGRCWKINGFAVQVTL